MSTIHTEASVAASEVEPSASNVYDYSESINDNDEKLDEGLRAPIPMHDDAYDLDTSLLSDNELEAFVKTKQYGGKSSSIPSNLDSIFQRCTGYNKWTSSIYKNSQTKNNSSSNKNKTVTINPQSTPQSLSHGYKTLFSTTLPQIQSSDNMQQEESYADESTMIQTQNSLTNQSPTLNQPEQSPFESITPAASQANNLETIDSDADESTSIYKPRKQTIPFPISPTIKKEYKEKKENENSNDNKIENKMEDIAQPIQDCTLKEMQKMIGQLTSEVINLQQNLYIKDIMIKNMYLRVREFSHISFPQLMIERIHIVANYNNKHKYSHYNNNKRNKYGQTNHKRMTLSEEDSVSHGGTTTTHGSNRYDRYNSNNSYTLSIKHHSTVTLEVITRWLPRYNLPIAIKKGLIFLKEDDINDIDDYLIHQMYSDWNDIGNTQQNKLYNKDKIGTLDKIKKDEVHKQLINYMQHERVGLVRIEILRGKKYKKYKRIEKKFESLIIPITDLPKGDTYHIMIKVHNPSASIWGPLSNMVSIKVPLKFIDDDDTDNDNNVENNKKSSKKINNKTKR